MTPLPRPVLHMVCGKIGAGKSTLTRRLAEAPATVLISEDAWLAALYPGEIVALPDYVRASTRRKQAMADHVVALLEAGVSVVLDFPANTVSSRALQMASGTSRKWSRCATPAFSKMPRAQARLRARNASGEHPFETTDAQFDLITRHFVAPEEAEGFHVVRAPQA